MIPGLNAKVISALTRATIVARSGESFAICDLSGIEARVNAWGASDEPALELFRAHGDPYCRTASIIFDRPVTKEHKLERGLGKRCELGCGYGMGGPKFHATVIKYGGVWADVPIAVTAEQIERAAAKCAKARYAGPADEVAKAEVCVAAWRDVHKPIVAWWAELKKAATIATRGGVASAGPVTFARIADDLVVCELPSGRVLTYWQMREGENGLSYLAGKSGRLAWVRAYGGYFCENVVQAISRDLLAIAIVKCERERLPVVLHTHDEIVVEKRGTLPRLKEIMTEVPPWGAGIPIDAEGFESERYRK